jgi:hypothetical protein
MRRSPASVTSWGALEPAMCMMCSSSTVPSMSEAPKLSAIWAISVPRVSQ